MQTVVCQRLAARGASRSSRLAINHPDAAHAAALNNIRRWMSARPADTSVSGSPGGLAPRKKVTLERLRSMARRHKPITMLTAYDHPSATRAARAGTDVILVGDSLAQVALGYDSTTRVSMDEMLHHTRAVNRAVHNSASMVVVDMPFGSYHTGVNDAVSNAVRLVKEGGAEAVKLEGGEEIFDIVRALSRIGIPAIGHIGLCPQRHTQSSGYRVQGREAHAAFDLLHTAHGLRRAGACLLILEAIPHQLATYITSSLTSTSPSSHDGHLLPLPTIGIGAGPGCSGQVLVQDDMLGFWSGHRPRFVRQFMPSQSPSIAEDGSVSYPGSSIGDLAVSATEAYVQAVRSGDFPSVERGETYDMDMKEWETFMHLVDPESTGPTVLSGRVSIPAQSGGKRAIGLN